MMLFNTPLQFAFTIMFHYLFPQLTMGLALLIVIIKIQAYRKKDESLNISARFWAKIFALNFAMGVVTGIPMEFQFGTNWARFSAFAGGIIGQTLAMEGLFAFFLESTFLGFFLVKKMDRNGICFCNSGFLGSWVSDFHCAPMHGCKSCRYQNFPVEL
jgi:cytochrome d ubiquinol oxidase subunit I